MAQLIHTKPPEKDGDPTELWQTVRDLIKELNDLQITVIAPQGFCEPAVLPGNIQLRFTLVPCRPTTNTSGAAGSA